MLTNKNNVTIGDLVKHADWQHSPVPHYRDEVGLVVKYDKDTTMYVEVLWLPLDRKPRCKTFHCVESLEKYV